MKNMISVRFIPIFLIFTFYLIIEFSTLVNAEVYNTKQDSIIFFYVSSNKAIVDNKDIAIDSIGSVVPIMIDKDIYIPLRFTFEKLGGRISYSSQSSLVTVRVKDKIIEIKPDSSIINLNGSNVNINAKILNLDNKMFIPAKSLETILGKNVTVLDKMVIIKNTDTKIETNVITNYKSWFISSIALMSSSNIDLPMPKDIKTIYDEKNIYEDTINQLKYYSIKYPKLTKMFSIGKSAEGRDLMVLKVGTGPKKIFINAEHHSNEYITTMLTLAQIDFLIKCHEGNSNIDGVNIQDLLNQVSFYFLPLVNPDGVEICTKKDSSWFYNARGVDLDLNYDANWEKLYKNGHTNGIYPFSEPETQIMKKFNESYNFDVSISYHASGEMIYWYSGQKGSKKDYDYNLAKVLSKSTGYKIVSDNNRYVYGMEYKDWAIQSLGRSAFTIEVGEGKLTKPAPFSEFSKIWLKNSKVPVNIAAAVKNNNLTSKKENYHLILDDSIVYIDNYKIINNKLYIPLDKLSNTLGAKLEFYNNSRIIKVNGTPFVMSLSYLTIDGTGYVSLRSLSDILGLPLELDENTNTIYLLKKFNLPTNSNLDSLFPKTVVKGYIKSSAKLYSSIGGKPIKTISKGTDVEVLRDRAYKWYNIKQSDGTIGWVKSNVLSIESEKVTNTDIASNEEIEFYAGYKGFDSSTSYLIWVDLSRQKINVFSKNNNEWLLLKSYPCATGKNISPTIKGEFTINDSRGTWMVANKVSGVKYYVGFYDAYYFHSIKFYNKGGISDGTLSKQASAGCIRQSEANSKWIYDNIPKGTKVYIY